MPKLISKFTFSKDFVNSLDSYSNLNDDTFLNQKCCNTSLNIIEKDPCTQKYLRKLFLLQT